MRVFVTVGNPLEPFDRLLRAVDEALADLDVVGVCQHGSCRYRPSRLEAVAMLSRPAFEQELERSDAVICHAGVGTLMSAARHGHRPLVMPRLARHGEHVNDHQLEIAEELAGSGRVTIVADARQIREALQRIASGETGRKTPGTGDVARLAGVERALEEGPSRREPSFVARLVLRTLAGLGPPLDRMRVR